MLEESDCVELFTDGVQLHSVHGDWVLPLSGNGSIVPIKLDTGPQVCTMGKNSYHSLSRKPKLHSTKVQLRAHGNNKIEVLEKCVLNVQYKNRAVKLFFFIL